MIRNRRAYQLIQCRTHSRLLAGAAAVCAAACGHADLALYHLLHRGGAPLPDSTQADRAALTALCPKPAAEGECPPLPPQDPAVTLSVIVPVYNGEATIAACLDSILQQDTDCTVQLIVVDSDSTDGTAAVLERYRAQPGVVPCNCIAPRSAAAAPSAPAAAPPADAAPPVQFDLSTRGVDPGLFPFRTWARLQKELLYSAPELLTPGDARGDAALRQALAGYLAEYRGVQCDPEQLVVGAGLEYLLGLLAPLLPGPAAVETPGYPRARQVLENNGVPCRCLPVDADGLSLTALSASDAAVCYVTPSHQFPTGVTMPAGRRAELLHWAARAPGRRYIIEDDYDSEFRFDTRPLPSLQGMAGADGPVVYLSTCSRSLAPGIRIAYMVTPVGNWWLGVT